MQKLGIMILVLAGMQLHCLRANEQYQPEDMTILKPDMAEKAICLEYRKNMTPITHGIFQMGSVLETPEKDPHDQAVLDFMLDSTEVTIKNYRTCVETGACTPPAVGRFCNWGIASKDDFPANCVSYEQATQYCTFVCSRLPTEIEWEYAARGENSSIYPWGSDPPSTPSNPNTTICKSDQNCKVGQFASTRMGKAEKPGLYDMAGNVWEWTSSAWPCKYPLDRKDPNCGLPMPTERVVRGGYVYNLPESSLRAAYRHHVPQASQSSYVGFRCARTM